MNLTPSHRNPEEPQPETCDLCGLAVGAIHLRQSDVEGLRGLMVCDVTPGCSTFRAAISYNDRRRLNGPPQSIIGDSRVLPAGAETWWED